MSLRPKKNKPKKGKAKKVQPPALKEPMRYGTTWVNTHYRSIPTQGWSVKGRPVNHDSHTVTAEDMAGKFMNRLQDCLIKDHNAKPFYFDDYMDFKVGHVGNEGMTIHITLISDEFGIDVSDMEDIVGKVASENFPTNKFADDVGIGRDAGAQMDFDENEDTITVHAPNDNAYASHQEALKPLLDYTKADMDADEIARFKYHYGKYYKAGELPF